MQRGYRGLGVHDIKVRMVTRRQKIVTHQSSGTEEVHCLVRSIHIMRYENQK
jgi:hypothetical protein